MVIELIDDKDEEIEIEDDTPTPLTQEQLAAVGRAVARALDGLDIRELIRDSVQDTLGGMKRRQRTGGNDKEKR